MNEKLTSNVSYGWNWLMAFFGSVSTDAWTVIIAFIGMALTAYINHYWQKKRFIAEFGNEQQG
ncbi:hypothetical protein KSS82_11550 [Vibrio mimicus]|nr:hypothetical protein [Vibrio mimicus]EGQ8119351.1 hypothetical protein [Vibrio cholerae]QXC58671.1 hypothetical protein KSS82_11550 [Vibrio mimicus]